MYSLGAFIFFFFYNHKIVLSCHCYFSIVYLFIFVEVVFYFRVIFSTRITNFYIISIIFPRGYFFLNICLLNPKNISIYWY